MGLAFKVFIVALIIPAIFAENGQKSREKCSEYGKLSNDKDDLDKFSYAALLGLGEQDKIQWVCSGSLISEKFVLTVGHCMTSRKGPIRWVRLGHPTDATKQKVFEVSVSTVHPDYSASSFYNDIALLELKEPVDIKLITPTCLDTTEVPAESLSIISWGHGKNQQFNFQNLKAARHTNEDCAKELFKQGNNSKLKDGLNKETHMCAKLVQNSEYDCRGGGGGALQSTKKDADNHITYSIVGTTSFGTVVCEGATIYTRIFPFLSWIENIVWH